jgi:hypothetical protein
LLASLLVGMGGAFAGPVSGDDAAAAEAAPLASPALTTPALGEALTATGAARSAAPTQADAASPSAVAAEIIKEVQAGAGAAEPTRPVPRPATAATSAARTSPRADADDDALREWGKAAVAWVKQTIPWLRKDEEEERRPQATGLDQAGWNESPLEPGKAGHASRNDALPAINTAPNDPGTSVGYGAAPRAASYEPSTNLIREIIDTVRTVLEHPMAWLVGVLVIIGAIAVKKLDRRPTK